MGSGEAASLPPSSPSAPASTQLGQKRRSLSPVSGLAHLRALAVGVASLIEAFIANQPPVIAAQ
jgi:hypothetical protein